MYMTGCLSWVTTDCTYCAWLFSHALDVVFFDCINFVLQFCEMFYNIPAGDLLESTLFFIY